MDGINLCDDISYNIIISNRVTWLVVLKKKKKVDEEKKT